MLENVNLKQRLSREEYNHSLAGLQRRLYDLEKTCWDHKIPSIIVLEGWDGAGKGGAIASLTQRLDPRGFKVHSIHAPRDRYVMEVTRRQIQLRELSWQIYRKKRPVMVAFEGWDAAGKGGVIKRITEKMDPRGYAVFPISAPQGEDKSRHYLFRFWRRLPERGQIAIFDRTWYGRVLVERVEGFAGEQAWRRAYSEINSFERQLRDYGTILAKFWIHISPEEQLRRFEERRRIGYKSWKLTEEDWRNREKRQPYHEAVEEMLVKTSTRTAPWHLIEGNDKYWARVKTLTLLVETLSKELDCVPADPLERLQARSKGRRNKGDPTKRS